MEELLELLPTIAIIVFFVAKRKKKLQKAAADKPANTPQTAVKPANVPQKAVKPAAPAQPAAKKSGLPAQISFDEAFDALTELLEDHLPNPDQPQAVKVREKTAIETETARKPQITKSKTAAKPKAKPASGDSLTDDHGCIGGSMPDHSAEGESIAEHTAHELKRAKALQEEAAIRTESLRKPGLSELRKAVVMAEILDKPVSMRRRRI